MKSMTGFGSAQGTIDSLSISIEIQSVNRRNLELGVSLPREWQALEKPLGDLLKEKIQRGKVGVQVQVCGVGGDNGLAWDESALKETLLKLKRTAQEFDIDWPLGSDALVRLISLHKIDLKLPDHELVKNRVKKIFSEALDRFASMRLTEGAHLQKDIQDRIQSISDGLKVISEISTDTVPRYREMLFNRLKQAGLELDLTDERVLKEVSIFADKCDISEETVRLQSHLAQVKEVMSVSMDQPVGRKLEFIVQEIHRELNTIGSKANNLEVSKVVFDAKNELERIREQIQNVE